MRNYDITIFSKSYGADDDRDAFYLSVVATSVDKCLAQLKKFGVDKSAVASSRTLGRG